MGVSNIREELHQFINQADEETVNRIYEMIKSEHEQLSLTPEQKRDLEKRIKRDESESLNYLHGKKP